jgi:hypothetical protein
MIRGAAPLTTLVLATLTLSACASPAATAPSPTSAVGTLTGVVIAGVSAAPTVGQTMQLTASVTLSNGAQKALAATQLTWKSADARVATVSDTGLLTVTGLGATDVTGTYQSTSASAHVAVSFTISGVVHESAPTTDVTLAGALVTVSGGPYDQQTTTTDAAGHFVFAGLQETGFSLVVTQAGYDRSRYDVTVPHDLAADIALSPILTIVTEDRSVMVSCASGSAVIPTDWTFAVHHTGIVTLVKAEVTGYGPIETNFTWTDTRPTGAHQFAFFGHAVTLPGGFRYELTLNMPDDDGFGVLCGQWHAVWTHPS